MDGFLLFIVIFLLGVIIGGLVVLSIVSSHSRFL